MRTCAFIHSLMHLFRQEHRAKESRVPALKESTVWMGKQTSNAFNIMVCVNTVKGEAWDMGRGGSKGKM
jgi:hypothetical protein